MSNTDSVSMQQKLIKGRKTARFTFAMVIFGGGVLLLYGVFANYLPTVLNGIVLAIASIVPFVASKLIEKKLDKLQT